MSRVFVNASSQYLTNSSAVISGAPFSVCGWIKTTNAGLQHAIWSCCDGSVSNVYHELYLAGLQPVAASRGTTLLTAVHASSASSGVWAHVAGVWASTTSRKVYLNGASPVEDTGTATTATLNRTAIGSLYRATPIHFPDATIAHVATWNTALSDAEVLTLAGGANPRSVQSAALVSYAPLTSGDSPEQDIAWSGQSWTLVNAPASSSDNPPVNIPTAARRAGTRAVSGLYVR